MPTGQPVVRLGNGPRPLVVLQGLAFENKEGLLPRIVVRSNYGFLADDFTVYAVLRRPGLPQGYTLADMADDYAEMIREKFGGPVDVIGISTGGSIVLYLAADHPDVVRRLVIHSGAHSLSEDAKRIQLEIARLAGLGQWRKAYRILLDFAPEPKTGPARVVTRPLKVLGSWLLARIAPKDPSDLIVTVEAEDKHAFKDRLHEITVPTLVAGGTEDPGYTPALFRETAEGIPNARLLLYEGMGHPVRGKQFQQEVLDFLGAP